MAQVNIDVAKEVSVQAVNTKVGTSSDTASNTPVTLFAGIKGLIGWFTGVWTAARAAKLDNIQTTLNTPDGNTLGAWIEALQHASNTAINLLNNGTYGLNALKTGTTKKVQSGIIPSGTLKTGATELIGGHHYYYIDVTISAVDVTKTHSFASYMANSNYSIACQVVNSTTLRVYYYKINNISDVKTSSNIMWHVVEN